MKRIFVLNAQFLCLEQERWAYVPFSVLMSLFKFKDFKNVVFSV